MSHVLEDGRELMASYSDIQVFFEKHSIVGRKIHDIRPAEFDYMIQNMENIKDVLLKNAEADIETDGRVCIVFEDDDHLEIEYSGDGPVVLGFNTADFREYPIYDGSCYSLHLLFRECLGHTISEVRMEKTSTRMLFPAYKGIDMSGDDERIKEILFCLDDGSMLMASGKMDWFSLKHLTAEGGHSSVPFKKLINELNVKTYTNIFGHDNAHPFQKYSDAVREINFKYRQEFLNYIEEHKHHLIGKSIKGFYNVDGFYEAMDDCPMVLEFDTFCLVIEFFYYSDITIYIVDRSLFKENLSLEFVYRDIKGWNEPCTLRRDDRFPLYGVPIINISLHPFSEEFEINAARGETRPEGGDYFDVVRIEMENEQSICLCAYDAISDGYCKVRIESNLIAKADSLCDEI